MGRKPKLQAERAASVSVLLPVCLLVLGCTALTVLFAIGPARIGSGGVLRAQDSAAPAGPAAPDTTEEAAPPVADEFVGPFASWANAQTDYGAIGDGVADDTAALQRALGEIGKAGNSDVLYLPAGTYRITNTLNIQGKIHISILGEDPARTAIRWDGPPGGAMMFVNGVTLSRWGRITWDGAGRAGSGVAHRWDKAAPYAPTNLEHADEVFRDLGKGIVGGRWPNGQNDADVTIKRCKFIRCSQAGLSTESFNALEYWIWDSEFIDNARGATNEFGAGNFNIYRSVFRNSRIADITIVNTQFFSFRGNVSTGSRQFVLAKNVGQNAAQITIEENKILDTGSPLAIDIGNLGPVLLMDNQIRSASGASSPAVRMSTWAQGSDLISTGNKFTVSNPIFVDAAGARCSTLDDQTVPRDQIDDSIPPLPATAPNLRRAVFEVFAGVDGAAIQEAIDGALQFAGQRPVVHLPKGEYQISQPLTIPAGADVQILGDGYGTILSWSSADPGTVFRLAGPSKATIRDLAIRGNRLASGIVIESADQPGARVHAEGLYQEYGALNNVLADGLAHTQVNLYSHQHINDAGVSIKVAGNGGEGESRVLLLGGVSSSDSPAATLYDVSQDGRLMVLDSWYEGRARKLFSLRGTGTFTLQGARVAPDKAAGSPSLELDGFRGSATILNTDMDGQARIANEQADTNVLLAGIKGSEDNYFVRTGTGGNVAFRSGQVVRQGKGTFPIPDQGSATLDFIRSMLQQIRATKPSLPLELPPGVTDVRLYRIAMNRTIIGLHIRADGQPE